MMVTYTVKENQKPTLEQLREVEEAAKKPVVFDEDCPELSPKMMKALECAAKNRNRINNLKKA